MNAIEAKKIADGYMKSEVTEETIIVYDSEGMEIELDIIMLHIADYEGEAKWQVFEMYASIGGEDNFEFIHRNNGSDSEGSEEYKSINVSDILTEASDGHNWRLYEDLKDIS